MIELRLNLPSAKVPAPEPDEAHRGAVVDAAAPQPDLPQIAARLAIGLGSRWELRQPLAIGGTSTIFLLRHRLHGGSFVAKVLHPLLAEQAPLRQCFRSEAAHLALLSGHPRIPALLDLDQFDGLLYMLMSYIEGEDLDHLLTRIGPFTQHEALTMAAQIAGALDFAQSRGVLHGDLSPGNLRLDPLGQYHLLDFGLSRRIAGVLEESSSHWTGATPGYASPEQLRKEPPDIRDDLYSLGVILAETLTGRPLFAAANLKELEERRAGGYELPPALEQNRPIAELLGLLLAENRRDRIGSPALLLDRLAALGYALPERRERPAVADAAVQANTHRPRLSAAGSEKQSA